MRIAAFVRCCPNFVLLQDFFVEFFFAGEYRFAEIVAVNSVSGNELHTFTLLAVVKQNTVSLVAVAALSASKLSGLC